MAGSLTMTRRPAPDAGLTKRTDAHTKTATYEDGDGRLVGLEVSNARIRERNRRRRTWADGMRRRRDAVDRKLALGRSAGRH